MWHLGQGDTKPFEWPCKLLIYQTACLNMCFKLWHKKVFFDAFCQSLCHASYKTKSVSFYNYGTWTRGTHFKIMDIHDILTYLFFATSISFKKNISCVFVYILPNPVLLHLELLKLCSKYCITCSEIKECKVCVINNRNFLCAEPTPSIDKDCF